MDTQAYKKITQARTALLLNDPFFGALALRLRMVEDSTCKTEWTDGVRIGYNPNFINSISFDQVQAELVHEILHVSNGHCWRRDAREQEQWNTACDYAINPVIRDAGYKIDSTFLLDPQFVGMSAEQIYSKLPPKREGNKPSDEPGTGKGEVRDAPIAEVPQLEAEWQVATQQAAQAAQAQGKLPGSLKGMIEASREQRTDWRAYTLRFAQEKCASDYTWRAPNVRYVQAGLYLPSLRDERMGEMVVMIDTSGSVHSIIPAFGAHVQNVMDTVKPRLLHVIYCDDEVQHVDTYEPGDTVTLRQDGGGGTSFVPPFDYIAAQGIEPACAIYLTDLYGDFPTPASFPVLWASITKQQAPFGETIYIGD